MDTSGKNTITVNGQTADDYFHHHFPSNLSAATVSNRYGKNRYLGSRRRRWKKAARPGALRHGIARALVRYDESQARFKKAVAYPCFARKQKNVKNTDSRAHANEDFQFGKR
ncbi:MAG: 30S ribosomal protein S9 [bacterium]|nr:30S ribosomal protein S9 [bacterium]